MCGTRWPSLASLGARSDGDASASIRLAVRYPGLNADIAEPPNLLKRWWGKGGGEKWWARRGSNPRPLPCQGSALPLSYAPGAVLRSAVPRQTPGPAQPPRISPAAQPARRRRNPYGIFTAGWAKRSFTEVDRLLPIYHRKIARLAQCVQNAALQPLATVSGTAAMLSRQGKI